MKTIKRVANVLFRLVLLASFLLQSNVIPVQAMALASIDSPFLVAMAEYANFKYGGLVQDYNNPAYNNTGRKHLGFISVSLASLASIKVDVNQYVQPELSLMQGNASIYFDLDDYYSALHPAIQLSQEGRGTSENDQWVTIWVDLGYTVLDASLSPVNFGIIPVMRYQTEDDPLRNWGFQMFSASGLGYSINTYSKDEYGTVNFETTNGGAFVPQAGFLSPTRNFYRGEILKRDLDSVFNSITIAAMQSGSRLPIPPEMLANILDALLTQDLSNIDFSLRADLLIKPSLVTRKFTSTDEGDIAEGISAKIKSIWGGYDIDSDGIPDNRYPWLWNSGNGYANLSVLIYAENSNTQTYYIKAKNPSEGLWVGALDNDGINPFAPWTLLTGFVADQYIEVITPPTTDGLHVFPTHWLVTGAQTSINRRGSITFEVGRCQWSVITCFPEKLDEQTVDFYTIPSAPSGSALTITHTPILSATSGQNVAIQTAITSAKPLLDTSIGYITPSGESKFIQMSNLGGANYRAIIPASDVTRGVLQYYIRASNGESSVYDPKEVDVWHNIQVSDPVVTQPAIKTVTATPNQASYQPGQTVSVSVSLKDDQNVPVIGASLSFTLDNRNPSNAFTENGNGNYTIQFTAPSGVRDYPITVTASKSGYLTGQGGASITVYQSADPGHNLKANFISIDAGTHLPNQSIHITGNIVNLGTYSEQARLVFRLKDPNGVVIGTSTGTTFSIQAGYQSQNYSADLALGSSTGEYQAEVTAEIVGYSDFDPSDNKLRAPVYVGTTPTFNEFGLVQVAVVEGQTSGVVQNHKIKVLSASGSSATIDVLSSGGGTITDCYHKTVNVDVITLCDSDRFAVILDAVASSVPHEAWFYVGQGGNIDNTDITFSPETVITPAGTTASYHVTANATRRLVNFDITIRGTGDDFNTVSTWDFSSHRHGNYYDWDLELDVPGDATVKKYMYWVRFDDSNESTYDRFIRRLWVDVKQPHNIQLNSITPANTNITEGNTIQIQANLSNLSGYTEYNLDATCIITGPNGYSQLMTQSISSLGPNVTQNLTWNWATGGLTAGSYTVQVTVPLSIDALPTNNTLSVMNNLVMPPQLVVSPATDKGSYYQAENIQISASVISGGSPVTDASVMYFLKNSVNSVVFSGNLTHTSGGIYRAILGAPLQTGNYHFTVSAAKSGTIGSSVDTGTITINTAPPLVQIISITPANGELINYNDIIFNWAGSAIGVPTSQLQYSYRLDAQAWTSYSSQTSLTLTNVSEGNHNFDVKVRVIGGVENPTPVSRTFIIDTQPPVFQASPVANAASYVDGDTVAVQVDLDTSANVTASFNSLDSQYSPSLVAVTETNPASHIYTITYLINSSNTFPDNSYPVTVYAIDNVGNTSIDSTLFVRIDNSNPTVTETNPVSGATNVDPGSAVTVYFSEPMNKASVQSAFSISPLISGTMAWVGNSLIIDPSTSLTCGTSYTMQLSSGATDLVGKLLSPTSWSFTTVGCNLSEIDIRGNGISIVDGDTTPSPTDHTDFGSLDISSASLPRPFTIYNTGTVNLTLNGSPKVSITGCTGFTVSTQPSASTVVAGGSTAFTITFDPSVVGTCSATVSISNTDSDESPYNFSLQGVGTTAGVFEDHFTDNNITSNPTWTPNNNAFSVANGILNSDGLHTDQSDRYLNGFNSHVSMPVNDYLEYSYRGLLKSQGSPQAGRGTQLVLGSSQTDKNYSLNIQRGQTNGFPTNKYSLSLSYGTSGTITDLIVTNFQPNYDQFYNIKAVRVSGQWSLYVDGSLIGTAQDPGGFSQLENIVLYTVGSVSVDDIKVSTIPLPNIEVHIGGINRGSYYVPMHGSMRQSFTGLNNGPVKIINTDAQSLIAAERLIYKVNGVATSFTEMMGLPDSQLDNTYWLPWYNNVDLDTQLRFANVSGSPATVTITIGGLPMGDPIALAAGASTRVSFAGVNNGPVKIISTQNIVAAERLIYKVAGKNTSFTEMMALPNKSLDTTYWLPWYNNVDLDTQLRFANVSTSPAQVHVYIGGVEMQGSPFPLAAGESTRKSFPGINDGPVQIVSDQNIVAAERLIYKVNGVNTSFTEMMALPNSALDTTYWLPWYNNKDLDTQLRFANVHETDTATVHVYIGGTEMPNSPFTLLPGDSTRQSFVNINNGPVQIVSNVQIVAAERLIYKVNNTATSFSEMMALPNSQLDTTYWLPWYNNLDLDTQLRFGVP